MAQILPPLVLPTQGPGTPVFPGTPGPAGPPGAPGIQGPPGPDATLAGDVEGASDANVVTRIRGHAVQEGAYGPDEDGHVLTWVNADGYLELKPVTGGGGGGWPTNPPGTVEISEPISIQSSDDITISSGDDLRLLSLNNLELTTPGSISIESSTTQVHLIGHSSMPPGIYLQAIGSGNGILLESEGVTTINSAGNININGGSTGSVFIQGVTTGGPGVEISSDDGISVFSNNSSVFISAEGAEGDVVIESTQHQVLIQGTVATEETTLSVALVGAQGISLRATSGPIMLITESDVIQISASNDVSLESSDGDININGDGGAVGITANGQLTLQGEGITLHSNELIQITTTNNAQIGTSTMGGISLIDFTSSGIFANSSSGLTIGNSGGVSAIAFSDHATINAPSLTIPNAIRAVSIHLPGQGTSIGITDLITSPGSGLYAVDIYLITTVVSSGSINVNIHHTDEAGANVQIASLLDLSTTSRAIDRLLVGVNADALQYSVTGSIGVGAEYSLRISVTKIG